MLRFLCVGLSALRRRSEHSLRAFPAERVGPQHFEEGLQSRPLHAHQSGAELSAHQCWCFVLLAVDLRTVIASRALHYIVCGSLPIWDDDHDNRIIFQLLYTHEPTDDGHNFPATGALGPGQLEPDNSARVRPERRGAARGIRAWLPLRELGAPRHAKAHRPTAAAAERY